MSQPVRSDYDISFRKLGTRASEVWRWIASLCAGSLLVAREVSGVIHERLKGANVPAERVFSLSKKKKKRFHVIYSVHRIFNICGSEHHAL